MNVDNSTQMVDFSEIGSHFKFEQFAADLLQSLGYEVLAGPGEGNDGGKDLIVADVFEGLHGRRRVKYLVSCKYKLSGPVGVAEEFDIAGRVQGHDCDAFLGFYSTHVTQGLVDRGEGLKRARSGAAGFDVVFLQDADIRRHLLELPSGSRLVSQWFPRGYAAYKNAGRESFVYGKRPEMRCAICKLDLLQDFSGVIVYKASHAPARHASGDPDRDARSRYHIWDITPYCVGHVPQKVGMLHDDASMEFELRSLIDPRKYIERVFEDVKFMYAWPPYFVSIDVFRKWNHLVHILYYFVARRRTGSNSAPSAPGLLRAFGRDDWTL